jgi:caa(3)-type oxidase subunit IV
MSDKKQSKSAAYRRSTVVALVLAALTILEFFTAHYLPSVVVLMLLATFKAVLVLNYFMHVSRLWTPEGEH